MCDGDKTEKSGENWKITIPFNQELTAASKESLQKYISPIIDYASQLEEFWEMNKNLKAFERIVFVVDKSDIKRKTYQDLLSGLKRLEANPELLHASKGKVDIWIHGYNEDSRELWEIAEVKKWSDKVFAGINGWVYFLVKDEHAQFLRLLQLFNVKYKVIGRNIRRKGGRLSNQIEIDHSTGGPFLNKLFLDLNLFCAKHNISLEINKEVSYDLGEFLTGEKIPPELRV